jgi:hypothetical protein
MRSREIPGVTLSHPVRPGAAGTKDALDAGLPADYIR